MREDFEVRLMELMIERSDRLDIWPDEPTYTLEPWEAIECVNKMLNEFEATIYQP